MKKKRSILGGVVFIAIAISLILPLMVQAGDLQPSAPPAPTMKTMDNVPPTWSQKIAGAARFELVLDGEAVLDKETGLVWEQSPMKESFDWSSAKSLCMRLELGGRKGF